MQKKEDIRKYIKEYFSTANNANEITDIFINIMTMAKEEYLSALDNKTIKLEPSKNQQINVFDLNGADNQSNITKPVKDINNLNEQLKFEKLVKTLAKLSYDGKFDDEIDAFEESVRTICELKGLDGPYFGIARSNWSRIDYTPNYCPVKFYAEYYDGNQAPFIVCEWDDDIEKLELLLKEASEELYNKYKENLMDIKYF